MQIGPSSKGGANLGTVERRYSSSQKLAQEDTKKVLSKAEEKKKMGGLTATKQPPTPVEIDPMHTDIIGARN